MKSNVQRIHNVDEDEDYHEVIATTEEILSPINAEDIVFFVTFVIGILSNLLVIYCILRFKKMKTKVNLCLLNWTIANCFTLLTQDRSYKLVAHTFGLNIFSNVLCYTLEYRLIFHAGCAMFIMLLTIDYIFNKLSVKKLNLTFLLIWAFIIINLMLSSTLCAIGINFKYSAISLLLIFFVFILLILMKCDSYKKSNNITERVKITLSTFFLIYWLVVWVVFAANIMFYRNMLNIVHLVVILLIYVYPLLHLLLLIKIDKNFKLCVLQAIRCSNQYVEATICYKEDNNNEVRQDNDINDENSSIDIVMSTNNEQL